MGRRFRPVLPRLARATRARARPLVPASPGPGAAGLLQRPEAGPPGPQVPLPRHPGQGVDRRKGRLPQGAEETPRRPQPGRDGPLPRRATEPQAPRLAHDRLRRWAAALRGRPPPRRGHRRRPHGHPRPPGQGAEGPRCDALAAAPGRPPRVLGDLPAQAVPLPRTRARPAGQPTHRPDGLPACAGGLGAQQARSCPYVEAQLRHSPARVWHRPPHDPGPARAPQLQHHRPLPPYHHGGPEIDPQPVRRARRPCRRPDPAMTRPRLEVAEVIRSCRDTFLERYGASLTTEQRRALDDLTACRSAALGGHVLECPGCGYQEISYNSCGNRHCPKCQAAAAARWLETQAADLLDTPYFHVVFSLPGALGPMALSNPRVVYGLLMRAAAQTLLEVAANPKHLGAEVGVLEVLHTWGQNLALHPHVHCVVTGGGLALDESRWIAGRDDYFLPVPILRRVFRGKFLAGLRTAFRRGRLRFPGRLAALARPRRFHRLMAESVRTEWVVYAKAPWQSAVTTLKYLARYTHRVAISNRRLVSLADGQVTFDWKDYADGGRQGTMTLDAIEFVRRFLTHVLPSGFVRVRHYGLLANRHRQEKLARCRELLGMAVTPQADTDPTDPILSPENESTVTPTRVCPRCGAGRMVVVAEFPPLTMAAGISGGSQPSLSFDRW